MSRTSMARACLCAAAAALWIFLAGCAALRPAEPHPISFYAIDGARFDRRLPQGTEVSLTEPTLTLLVTPPRAGPGFDSRRILYVRTPHRLEYFAHSEWVDTPARMLATLVVSALEQSGAFVAVAPTPSAAAGDLRLDTEIVRLQHEFDATPSRVRFTLRAQLVNGASRQVVATGQFDETVAASSDDPYGGVVAANRAVHAVLERLADFCSQAAKQGLAPAGATSRR